MVILVQALEFVASGSGISRLVQVQGRFGLCLIDAGYVITSFHVQMKPSGSYYSKSSFHPTVCCPNEIVVRLAVFMYTSEDR
jgi:hypothetical protein